MLNANSCWQLNIYKHEKYNTREFESKKNLIFQQFSLYEHLKCPA